MKQSLKRLRELDAEIHTLSHISALLSWDQETYLPAEGVEDRAEQCELAEGLLYDRITCPQAASLLESLGVDDGSPEGPPTASLRDRAFLREFYRRYRRKVRIPRRLVTEMAKQTAIAQRRWAQARKKADFSLFAPHLEVVLGLVKEMASAIGYQGHPYDALLEDYEPYLGLEELERVFGRFEGRLKELFRRICSCGKKVRTDFLKRDYEVEKQKAFGLEVLEAMGYDFQRGRLDESVHPFTTTLGRSDIRLTTRYSRNYFPTGLFSIIHEGGHGLYELGIGEELQGSLLADGTSMGIHESQSRLWENLIGRSLAFWEHFYPRLRALFPQALAEVELESFYQAVNAVEPSFIRTEADEVTYNLHILLRFHLEKRLVGGELGVQDLPEAWNRESRQLLGITPTDPAQGVLQDIHWSMGSFGYFPTYSLGNLYGAQFFKALRRENPQIEEEIRGGNLGPILDWLRGKIHWAGKLYPAGELCRRVTGGPLDPDIFLEYLEAKYAGIYGV